MMAAVERAAYRWRISRCDVGYGDINDYWEFKIQADVPRRGAE